MRSGQAASAGLQLSIAVSTYIQQSTFNPAQSGPSRLSPDALKAIAETIHWAGIIACLSLLAQASFWLIQATLAISLKRPKPFHIGMWSLTFPYASYTLAWMVLAKDLRNHGMAGFAAANSVVAAVIWLFCAGMTVWRALITGQMFILDQPTDAPDIEHRDSKFDDGVPEDRETHCMNERDGIRGAANRIRPKEKDIAEAV